MNPVSQFTIEKEASVIVPTGFRRVKKLSPDAYISSVPGTSISEGDKLSWKFPISEKGIFPEESALTKHTL